MIGLKVKFDLAIIFLMAVPFFFSFLCIRIVWFFSTYFVFGIAAISLPADVLWGSFVMHSFVPHGRLLNTADITFTNHRPFTDFCKT